MPIWNPESRTRLKVFERVLEIRNQLMGNGRREPTEEDVTQKEDERVLGLIRNKIKEQFYTFEETAQGYIQTNELNTLLARVAQEHSLSGSPIFEFTLPDIYLDRLKEDYRENMESILRDGRTDLISDEFIKQIISDFHIVPTMRVELGSPMGQKHLIINIYPQGSSFRLRCIRKGFTEQKVVDDYTIEGEEVNIQTLRGYLRSMSG